MNTEKIERYLEDVTIIATASTKSQFICYTTSNEECWFCVKGTGEFPRVAVPIKRMMSPMTDRDVASNIQEISFTCKSLTGFIILMNLAKTLPHPHEAGSPSSSSSSLRRNVNWAGSSPISLYVPFSLYLSCGKIFRQRRTAAKKASLRFISYTLEHHGGNQPRRARTAQSKDGQKRDRRSSGTP